MSKQLDDIAIKYLIAFKRKYNIAKRVNSTIICVSFIMALLSIIITKFYSDFKNIFAVISFVWGILTIYLNKFISNRKKAGADLQELYDTYIFNIKKNEKIMYPLTTKHNIYNYGRVFYGDNDKYYDYLNDDNICNDDIINVQKDNILYDKKIRKVYREINKLYLFLYIVIILVISIKWDLKIFDLIYIFWYHQ